jgi:hypothetical protein
MRRRRKKVVNPAPSYEAAHWGVKPKGTKVLDVPNPRDNTRLVGLGAVVSIVYLTEKGGDGELVEYEHEFSKRTPPLLAYGKEDGRLYLVGGGYKMTIHGIVD